MTIAEQTQAALERIRERGGTNGLNCVAEVDSSAMMQAEQLDARQRDPQALLWGVPVLVKDNIDVKGLRTTAGSLALADHIAREDAPVIANLRRNGAVILGKTNMTEFANYTGEKMPGGYSSRGGQVIHAVHPSLSPSGSSSGSAVAVAAGIVSMALGTDTSFSIVGCAQENGVCGLKPPAGALHSDGIIPIARTLDSAGAMANSFSDALKLYSAMRDQPLIIPEEVQGMHIAVNQANEQMVSPGQKDFLNEVLAEWERHRHAVSRIHQPYSPYQRTLMQYEFKTHLEEYLHAANAPRKTLKEIVAYYLAHPETMMTYGIEHLRRALEETPDGLESTVYQEALYERQKAIAQSRALLAPYDAVMMTGPTNIMHFCGLPCVSIAAGQKNGHGVKRGIILYGLDEIRLYRAALALEEMINPQSKLPA